MQFFSPQFIKFIVYGSLLFILSFVYMISIFQNKTEPERFLGGKMLIGALTPIIIVLGILTAGYMLEDSQTW